MTVSGIQAIDTFVTNFFNVTLQIGFDLFQQRCAYSLADGQFFLNGKAILLRYHNVSQVFGINVQLLGLIVLQRVLIMLQVVFDAIVNVCYIGSVNFVLNL